MCGIGGYQLKQSATFNADAVLATIEEMQRHRGPDGRGRWISKDGITALCHTRLAIVDLTDKGAQPMSSVDGCLTITYNGEIYNWRELRNQLEKRGVKFYTNSDTEIILAGYQEWGYDVLQRIRGMYAFALWVKQDRTLFCARDRVGKKPFVYSQSSKGFFFASEIPPLKRMAHTVGIDISHDETGLANMLLHNLRHIPEPCTAYKGIRKLRPGHALIVKNGVVERVWRHWVPQPVKVNKPKELRSILEEAVAIRTIADVPVGALLSGGIDSTAIVHLMQQHNNQPVRTYAFGVDKNDEDLRRARLIATKLGTKHKEFYFDPGRQYEILKKILVTYGEPIMLLPLIHAYELSEAIRDEGIKVVLNGNGADELFYGYTGHLKTAQVTRLINMLGWLRYFLPRTEHPKLSVLLAPPGKRKAVFYRRKAQEYWPTIFQNDFLSILENVVSREMDEWGMLFPHEDFIDESNYLSLIIENTHSLTISSDLPAMMASVEMRAPFLDQYVISAAMGIHFSKKIKGPRDGSQLKNILRKAVSDLVPAEIMQASKRGFGMGVQERDVLRGPWEKYADNIFTNYPLPNLFDANKIRKMWIDAKQKGEAKWDLLAKLFAIGMWEYTH